jgi:DNA-binding transcriptional ArsR family regulator
MPVDAALRALGHPARRAMLRLVLDQERSSSALADQLHLSRPATSQHLKMLRQAGLVHVRVDKNQRLYRVDFALLAEVKAQLDTFWSGRLETLAQRIAHDTHR